MLTLPIKKEWFDKIASGEKSVEYRERKPYWESRLKKVMSRLLAGERVEIKLRNGYSETSPEIVRDVENVCIINGRDSDLRCSGKVFAICLKKERE